MTGVRSHSEWNQKAARFEATGTVPCPDCGIRLPAGDTAARKKHYQSCGQLEAQKQLRLEELEVVIERGLKTFYEVGSALLEIRDNTLYDKKHQTFEDYCRSRWHMVASRARQLISASEVIANLEGVTNVTLPQNEGQAREYMGLEPDEQKALAALSKAVLGDKPTAAGIRDLKELSQSLLASGAITVDGQSVGLSEVLEYSLTEEQHERHLRRKQHIADSIEARLADEQARLAAAQTPLPAGKYRCIVIDPPWQIKKIDRDVRPHQGQFLDYPTMTIDQIRVLPVPDLAHEDGCHLYLWTTQKYLPDALALLVSWDFHYQCLMTWVKPSGFTPYSWMYNTEHVIFARRGNLPLLQNGLKLSIEAPTAGHSVKPDAFFERVLQASPEPRLEMFARQTHEGFKAWGNEARA